jgi:hypothetical protein
MSEYLVVFEYTAKAGGYEGVRTFTPYKSKEDFEEERKSIPNLLSGKEIVLKEGIPQDEVDKLIQKTPLISYVRAAFEDARMPDGSTDPDILEMHLMNTAVLATKRSS